MICCFFGHRNAPSDIKKDVKKVIEELIVNKGVKKFYVGNNGSFDGLVLRLLIDFEKMYNIEYNVVFAYHPKGTEYFNDEYYAHVILPELPENTPPRFRIDARNRWMINKSDYVITYVRHSFGGAAKFEAMAYKQNKKVIKI